MDLRDQLQSSLGATYTLERELGGGGMSRVFVAEDATLGRKVVVKVLAPELGSSVNFERFKREISLAARLQHPHIVPLLTAGEVDGVPYFTMPFVEGESLRARIAHGELPMADAVAYLRDIAKALEYAHSKGVLHRDIKPDNVLLTGGSAAVTDFGVAKAISSSTLGDETLTSVGIALGTPAYMAPEQATADPSTDHRADIYAFGVTAYEMLAGRPPFVARSAQQFMVAHATEAAAPLDRIRPATPKPIVNLVMRCLEKRPADRPQSVRELLAALDAIATPGGFDASSKTRGRTARTGWAGIGAVVLVVAAIATAFVTSRRREGPLNPKRVMVAAFETVTGDTSLALVGRIASDFLTQGLSELDSIDAVSSTAVRAAATNTTGLSARQVAEQLRAGTLISGSVYKQGDSLRFHAEVSDARNGKLLQSIDATGPVADPIRGVRALRERLMGAIAIRDAHATLRLRGAPRYDAYEAFILARERFDHQDYGDAIVRLHRVIALDSTFGSAYTVLAVAYSNMGRWSAADSVARIADRLRDQMSKPERAQLDWTVANIKGDLETAHRIAEQGAARDSDWVSLWLTAYHAMFLNRPRETVKILSVAKPPAGWWPQWNALGNAHHLLGEFDDEFRVAQQGNALYPGRLVAAELRALGAKGDVRRVRGIIDSVESASTDTVLTPADLMLSTAIELRAHDHESDAAELMRRATKWLAVHEQDVRGRRTLRRTAAEVFFVSGQFDSAQVRYAQLAADDTFPFDVIALGRAGSSAAFRGDTVTARRIFDELGRIDRPYSFGEPSYRRAAIAATLEQKEISVRLLGEALSRGARKMPELHRLEEFRRLRGYPPFDAIVRPKG